MQSSDTLPHLIPLRFWPFEPQPPPPDAPPDLPSFPPAAAALFATWARTYAHHYPRTPDLPPPTPAAARVFALLAAHSRRPSPLRLSVHPDTSTTPPCAALHILLPAPPLPVGPLVRPSHLLRPFLWHAVRAQRSSPAHAPHRMRDRCGFVACAAACAPVRAADRHAFRMDAVFAAAGEDRARPIKPALVSSPLSSPMSPPISPPPPPPPLPSGRSASRVRGLVGLPEEVLHKIVTSLHPTDFAALSHVNAEMRQFMLPIVPGLKLRLYPHQLCALGRMVEMEARGAATRPVPLLHRLTVVGAPDVCVAADLVQGSLMRLVSMPLQPAPQGGLFCDEPGLGKTITALSLVLKTLGQLPRPPKRYARERTVVNGEEAWVYRVPLSSRYNSFGVEAGSEFASRRRTVLPECEGQGRRTSGRHVHAPDHLARGKGVGSVPVLGGGCGEGVEVFLSKATLVVVPNVLTMHWMQQIKLHVKENHLNVLLLKTPRDLPESAEDLALNYDLVVASFDVVGHLSRAVRDKAPILMRTHFLRVIVDEGHTISTSNLSQFSVACDRLRAERRWVMTGTPTPSKQRSGVDHLHALLKFIREESYGLDKGAWHVGVREPYSQFRPESLERLRGLLKEVMIRADKRVLPSTCHTRNVLLDFTDEGADCYNWLVSLTKRNMINCDWFSERHAESLFNKKNLPLAQAVVRNLRYASCMSGTQQAVFTESEVIETLDILYEKYRSPAKIQVFDRFDDPVAEWPMLQFRDISEDSVLKRQADIRSRVKLFEELNDSGTPYLRLTRRLKKAVDGKMFKTRIYAGVLYDIGECFLSRVCTCARCYEQTSIPMVTPCGHMLCEKCVILDMFRCTANHCGHPYTMAPGADHTDVPEDLIELQPSAYSKDGWKPDWDYRKGAKLNYLLQRILALPMDEEFRPGESGPRLTRPKVIIHSQFVDHLHSVAMWLQRSALKDAYVELYKNARETTEDVKKIKGATALAHKAIKDFTEQPEKSILLMNTKQGSVGLDLSFVQYIFLMEPVWDPSVELQIVSRAHRIGCRSNIYIERLVMKGSVESDMLKVLERRIAGKPDEIEPPGSGKVSKELSLVRTILRNLTPVIPQVEEKAPVRSPENSSPSGSSKRQREVEQIVEAPRRTRICFE